MVFSKWYSVNHLLPSNFHVEANHLKKSITAFIFNEHQEPQVLMIKDHLMKSI